MIGIIWIAPSPASITVPLKKKLLEEEDIGMRQPEQAQPGLQCTKKEHLTIQTSFQLFIFCSRVDSFKAKRG